MTVRTPHPATADVLNRLIDQQPAYTRLHKEKKITFADGSQIDLLIAADRTALAEMLGRMAGRLCAGGLEANTPDNLAQRLSRLDRGATQLLGTTPVERLALFVLTGWTMAEIVLTEVRAGDARMADFFERTCRALTGLVRDVLPGGKPVWFAAYLPNLARATAG
ncbi:hypothetical protein [Azospirillum sp. ST 5-10]|uniref:hypothetical protein n=1 Tax=unclassified Azospirillum TaxID=2630922 RepID=UPI003F4A555A